MHSAVAPNSRLYRILAIALFLSCLALQSAFSSEPASITAENAKVETPKYRQYRTFKPFSKIAVGVNVGTLGAGVEVATPISRKANLRVDSHFFQYAPSFDQSGIPFTGNLNMRDTRISYDFYPFAKGFRISGGVAIYNKFNFAATGLVAGGKTVTFNNTDYYSSAANPLNGNASLSYGRTYAPTLTIGWGNAIPRSGRHLAFPFEFGAAFTDTPTFNLNMAGSACLTAADAASNGPTCAPAMSNANGFVTSLNKQIQKIRNDVAPMRVYPILNMGVTYRF